jgi:hypothetical protein
MFVPLIRKNLQIHHEERVMIAGPPVVDVVVVVVVVVAIVEDPRLVQAAAEVRARLVLAVT